MRQSPQRDRARLEIMRMHLPLEDSLQLHLVSLDRRGGINPDGGEAGLGLFWGEREVRARAGAQVLLLWASVAHLHPWHGCVQPGTAGDVAEARGELLIRDASVSIRVHAPKDITHLCGGEIKSSAELPDLHRLECAVTIGVRLLERVCERSELLEECHRKVAIRWAIWCAASSRCVRYSGGREGPLLRLVGESYLGEKAAGGETEQGDA